MEIFYGFKLHKTEYSALFKDLYDKAVVNPRLRQNMDLRNSAEDNSQRMLNALMPGTEVPIHRHPLSNENVLLLCGKLVEIYYDDNGVETARYPLDPSIGNYGCVVPAGVWHTVDVLEPSVIYEAKDGRYGQDGSETLEEFTAKSAQESSSSDNSSSLPNSIGDLKKNIEYLIGMELQSGSMDVITPLYVSRMLNVPLEDVEECMKEMGV